MKAGCWVSGLDVAEAILGWEPGLGRVVACLTDLKEACQERVEKAGTNSVSEAFDQIGGMLGVALEDLQKMVEEKRRKRAE